jgi:hypothetical protein
VDAARPTVEAIAVAGDRIADTTKRLPKGSWITRGEWGRVPGQRLSIEESIEASPTAQ